MWVLAFGLGHPSTYYIVMGLHSIWHGIPFRNYIILRKYIILVIALWIITSTVYRLIALKNPLGIVNDTNMYLRESAMINNAVWIDVYGMTSGNASSESFRKQRKNCHFRMAIVHPFKWIWLNMNFQIFKLYDNALVSSPVFPLCSQSSGSIFLQLIGIKLGHSRVETKAVCLPFTFSSLIQLFAVNDKTVRHTRLQVPTNTPILHELVIPNILLQERLFTVDGPVTTKKLGVTENPPSTHKAN